MIGTTPPLPLMLMFEKSINQRLKQDTLSLQRLQKLNGLVFEVSLRDPALCFFITPTHEGILLLRQHEAFADARILASSLGLLRASRAEHKMDALFNGDIQIEGNQAAAESLLRILGNIDSDPFARLADKIGAAPAGFIERKVDRIRSQAKIWRRTRQLESVDFMVYERALLVGPDVLQAQLDEIDTLRDRVDHLAVRIERLVATRTARAIS
jgi:ubiquinone biosynthesis accessory factor UbiJ